VTIVPGSAFMDSLMSFSIIRGGHLDLSVMGALQVSEDGDLANWRLPGRRTGGIGGAADLAAGSRRVWVMTTHNTKDGEPKLVRECTYPLTAKSVVTRVYSDLGVMDVSGGRFRALRLAPGVSLDELRMRTEGTVELAV
jgi:3-oxoacid CoA-transferase subunit B